jgi:hypothetical protein
MLEANAELGPRRLRDLIVAAAQLISGAEPARQGAGAVDAGRAVTLALADGHTRRAEYASSPVVERDAATFLLHDHTAGSVSVLSSWSNWRAPGHPAQEIEPGLWQARVSDLEAGRHPYKFLLDGGRWLVDPANPSRVADGLRRLEQPARGSSRPTLTPA